MLAFKLIIFVYFFVTWVVIMIYLVMLAVFVLLILIRLFLGVFHHDHDGRFFIIGLWVFRLGEYEFSYASLQYELG